MTDVGTLGRAAWRLWNTDGVPSSGARRPPKADILAFVDALDAALASLTGYRAVTAAGDVTGLASDRLLVINKTVGAATAVSLPPTPTPGQRFTVLDGKGDAGTNNITISGSINGGTSYVISANFGVLHLVAISATAWRILG